MGAKLDHILGHILGQIITKALQLQTCIKIPNMTWAWFWAWFWASKNVYWIVPQDYFDWVAPMPQQKEKWTAIFKPFSIPTWFFLILASGLQNVIETIREGRAIFILTHV